MSFRATHGSQGTGVHWRVSVPGRHGSQPLGGIVPSGTHGFDPGGSVGPAGTLGEVVGAGGCEGTGGTEGPVEEGGGWKQGGSNPSFTPRFPSL